MPLQNSFVGGTSVVTLRIAARLPSHLRPVGTVLVHYTPG
jgi:hypothetical protein